MQPSVGAKTQRQEEAIRVWNIEEYLLIILQPSRIPSQKCTQIDTWKPEEKGRLQPELKKRHVASTFTPLSVP